MIASVAFRNFKALRGTSLALTPFNLVIGPNGSGKTTLIQALLRLRSLSNLPPADGIPPVKSKSGPAIAFRFSPPHDAIEVRLGCSSDLVCDVLQVVPPEAPGWPALRTNLGTIRSYLLDHTAMAESAMLQTGTELSPSGGNLAAVLAHMRTHVPADFTALVAELVRILPEFTALELKEGENGAVGLSLRLVDAESVSAENLSQGALYLLAMLTLAFDPAPPSVLCLEEIDRGIHPRMLREVRDTLYRLSHPQAFGLSRAPVQIIATTHSPYLLDLFREHPEEVVIMQKHGNAARFERLSDRADLVELLREGSLGDMWFSGILGGVTEEQ